MKPWPILLLVRKLDHGGCERDLSKVALGLDRTRFEPHVGCFRPEGLRVEELQRAGVPIVQFPVMSFRSMSAVRGAIALRRYIKDRGIRLVHAYDVPTAMFAAPVARLTGNAAVLISQLSYRTLYSPWEHRLLRIVDRFAHAVIVNCKAMQRHMVDDERLPEKRTRLCYNGVDTAVFHPAPAERPAALRGARVVIGTVANLREEKGLDLLLRAFARVRRVPGDMKCYIVGSGPCEEDLHNLARNLGILEDCIFQPGRPDVSADFRFIDVFVLPSYSEAFSNALLEAMTSGCASVGSRVGGTPELIRHGENGLLFERGSEEDLASKLEVLAGNTEYREKLGSQARMNGEQFALSRNLDCFSRLYQSMIEQYSE